MPLTRTPEEVYERVNAWTRKNHLQEWSYHARYNWYRLALESKVITQAEYENAQRWHGRMWTYVGD